MYCTSLYDVLFKILKANIDFYIIIFNLSIVQSYYTNTNINVHTQIYLYIYKIKLIIQN